MSCRHAAFYRCRRIRWHAFPFPVPAEQVRKLLRRREFELLAKVGGCLRSPFALHAAFRAILAIGERDFSVAEFQQRFLNQILKLFDVNEKRAFALHSELNFGLYPTPDAFVFALCKAGCCDGVRDLVTEPRNDARLAGRVTSHIAPNDLWKLNGTTRCLARC